MKQLEKSESTDNIIKSEEEEEEEEVDDNKS